MNLQPVLKLPFRAGRMVFRRVRALVRPPLPESEAVVPAMPDLPPPPRTGPPPAPPAPPLGVRVEQTPNPNARKFVCSSVVVSKGSVIANAAGDAPAHPFVAALFGIGGVRTVFATKDFVTVTRTDDAPDWFELQDAIELVLRENVGA